MSWLQLRIHTERDHVPHVEKALNHAGSLSITLEDNADQPIFEPELGETPLWYETRVTGLFPADIDSALLTQQICAHARVAEAALHWHVLEDKDWEREWMQHYHPIQCGDNFWICPSWIDAPNPNAINLMLDPGLAFGTGTHPTTFMCLQWLAHLPKTHIENKQIIDYGCGSGILGIATLLLGAKRVLGVDIDPQALIATQENITRNQLDTAQFPVCFPAKVPIQHADVVLANILAGPLVELAPILTDLMAPGAKLCLSGILVTQKEAIIEAYEHLIDFDHSAEKDNWICLAGTKRI